MATLCFSLAPNALIRLHDALICLAKFSETVSIEAEYDLVSPGRGGIRTRWLTWVMKAPIKCS